MYLFQNEAAMNAFDADPAGTIAKADKNWPELQKMKPTSDQ